MLTMSTRRINRITPPDRVQLVGNLAVEPMVSSREMSCSAFEDEQYRRDIWNPRLPKKNHWREMGQKYWLWWIIYSYEEAKL